MTYRLIGVCSHDLIPYLKEEIVNLGGKDLHVGHRAIYFDASEEVYYRVHLFSRIATRFYRIIKEFPGHSPTIIFDKAKRFNYATLFDANLPIRIQAISLDQNPKVETHLVGTKIREAITDSFKHYSKVEPKTSSYEAKVLLNAVQDRNRIYLSVDTAHKSLHKRGYRVEGHAAPLKENLAAALLSAVGYDGSQAFYDPMCGSGTIVIEASQVAMNKAAMIHRKKGEFGFEELKDFNRGLWKKTQDEARQNASEPKNQIFASDIDNQHVEIAKEAALKARVEKYISFRCQDFFGSQRPADSGIMVMNLPYGMRLSEQPLDQGFLDQLAETLKAGYKGWRVGLLMPKEVKKSLLPFKTQKTLDFLNGKIKVQFLVFDVF